MIHPIAKKSLGQYWLNDEASLVAMCEAAEVSKQDIVLEVGPGLGSLTKLLAKRAQKVISVEIDDILVSELSSRVNAANLVVVQADILKYDLTSLPANYKVVANIPYYLTGNLIRVLSETVNPAANCALLVQKEVAVRVAATPGDMSLLSVTTQFYWDAKLGAIVPARLFEPKPKVDSQILSLSRREQPLFSDINSKLYFRVAKAGFAQRRKTLLNSLSSGLLLDRLTTSELLRHANISESTRAQALSLEDWYRITKLAKEIS